MRESAIERPVRHKALHELKVPSVKLNLTGQAGWPDVIFWIPGGKPLLIEFKAPGEEANPLQQHNHEILEFLGYKTEVHDDEESALRSIAKAVGASRLPKKGR